jgi:hypothetical protein
MIDVKEAYRKLYKEQYEETNLLVEVSKAAFQQQHNLAYNSVMSFV